MFNIISNEMDPVLRLNNNPFAQTKVVVGRVGHWMGVVIWMASGKAIKAPCNGMS